MSHTAKCDEDSRFVRNVWVLFVEFHQNPYVEPCSSMEKCQAIAHIIDQWTIYQSEVSFSVLLARMSRWRVDKRSRFYEHTPEYDENTRIEVNFYVFLCPTTLESMGRTMIRHGNMSRYSSNYWSMHHSSKRSVTIRNSSGNDSSTLWRAVKIWWV